MRGLQLVLLVFCHAHRKPAPPPLEGAGLGSCVNERDSVIAALLLGHDVGHGSRCGSRCKTRCFARPASSADAGRGWASLSPSYQVRRASRGTAASNQVQLATSPSGFWIGSGWLLDARSRWPCRCGRPKGDCDTHTQTAHARTHVDARTHVHSFC